MRIDSRLEAVEERLKPRNLSGDLNLDRAAEMTYQWLRAQNEPEGTIERAMLLQQAQDLMEEVTKDD